jgi:hypothetical protein
MQGAGNQFGKSAKVNKAAMSHRSLGRTDSKRGGGCSVLPKYVYLKDPLRVL